MSLEGFALSRVGGIAFLTAGILRTVIASQLALPAPAVPAAGPRPDHLNGAQEIAASNFNLAKFNDLRSVMAIQGLVGSAPDGKFGSDTAERIAEFQQTNGLTADGKVGEQTLRVMVQQLNVANQQNAAIRLIIDFFNLSEHYWICFHPTLLTANATTGGDIPGPYKIASGLPLLRKALRDWYIPLPMNWITCANAGRAFPIRMSGNSWESPLKF